MLLIGLFFVVNYMVIKSIHEKVPQSQGAKLANRDLSTFYFLHFSNFNKTYKIHSLTNSLLSVN